MTPGYTSWQQWGLQWSHWFLWFLWPQGFTGYACTSKKKTGPFLFCGNKSSFQTRTGVCVDVSICGSELKSFHPCHLSHSDELVIMFISFLFSHKAFRSLMLMAPPSSNIIESLPSRTDGKRLGRAHESSPFYG